MKASLPAYPNKKLSEIRSLTGIRGIAAVYVVCFHLLGPIPMTGKPRTMLAHGYLAVDLFFVLSGFVMALNYSGMFTQGASLKTCKLFLARRFARIYPIYFIAILASCALVSFGKLEFRGASLWQAAVANLLTVQSWGFWPSIDPPAWSISAECFAYLVFPFVLPPILFRRPATAVVSAAICIASLAGLCAYWHMHPAEPKVLDFTLGPASLIRCVSEFCLGIVTYRTLWTRAGEAIKNSSWAIYPVVLAMLVLLAFRYTDFFLALLFPVFILCLCGKATPIVRFLGWGPVEYTGLLSYSIYLLHYLLISLIGGLHALAQSHGLPHAQTLAVTACFPLLFALSAAVYNWIEVPGRMLLRNWIEGPR